MRLGRPKLEQAEDDLRTLTDLRDRLNEYSEAMNTPIGEIGVTPYRAIGELLRLGREAAGMPRLGFDAMQDWIGTDFRRRQGLVEELQAKLSQMGVPSHNPFYGSTRTVLVPTEQARAAWWTRSNSKPGLPCGPLLQLLAEASSTTCRPSEGTKYR